MFLGTFPFSLFLPSTATSLEESNVELERQLFSMKASGPRLLPAHFTIHLQGIQPTSPWSTVVAIASMLPSSRMVNGMKKKSLRVQTSLFVHFFFQGSSQKHHVTYLFTSNPPVLKPQSYKGGWRSLYSEQRFPS